MNMRIFVSRDAGAHCRAPMRSRWRSSRLRTSADFPIEIVRTGSRGLYWLEPMVEVATPQRPRRVRPGEPDRCTVPVRRDGYE